MAGVAVLEVVITGNATSLNATLTQASASTTAFSKSATAAGVSAQKSFASMGSTVKTVLGTLGFAGAAVALAAFARQSFQAAVDYNAAFTKVAAITNASADQIATLKDRAMSLAGETAQSPVELANAIYYLASAGLSAQQQLEALDATARGAAIGMGTTGDLAKITAQALNVFGDSGLHAAGVMDALTAAVREGTAEPDEFADALGRVLPIADKAGLSFQEVTASLATMSNAGLKVNIGTTALRGLLQALVAPTNQSQTALAQMGLTVDDVVRSMSQQGLIATLRMLDTQAKKNTSTTGDYNIMLRNVIPNIRALTGAFNLTTQDAAKVDEIFQQVKNSTGDLADAFETTTQSPAFRMKQALNDLAIVGMNIASTVLPAIATALELIAPVIAAILPYAVQLGAVWLAWIAIPPILSALGVAFMVATGGAQALSIAVVELNFAAFGPWVVVAGIAVAALGALTGNFKIAAVGVAAFVIEVGYLGEAFTETQAKMGAIGLALIALGEAYKAVKGLQAQTAEGASGFAAQMESQNASLDATTASVEAALGPRQKFLDSFFSSHPNAQGYAAYDQAVQQVTSDIMAQNNTITAGTDIMSTYGGLLNNTSTTSLSLHGALAQVLTDYYKQNDGLRGLNTVQLNTLVNEGKWHAAINLVSDALDRSNAAIARQAQSQGDLRQSLVAQDFAKIAPFLDTISISFGEFQTAASAAFNGSQADADKFISDMTTKWTDAWNQFKSQAVTALDFTSSALADMGSAATSAQEQLAGDTSSMSTAALADLGDQATITGGEIVTAFKTANAQTKQFGEDLLQIAKFGGGAGKALASSLLQSGNTAAAAAIAGNPLEKQIVGLYNKNQEMVDGLSTKLTNAIVGPLDKIVSLLTRLARHWGLTINANTGKAKKDVDSLQGGVNKLTDANHNVRTFVEDHATGPLKDIQGDVDHLVGGTKKILVGVSTEQARQDLHNFDSTLDTFLQKKRSVFIGVHTGAESPWPDEALKQHLTDPMKAVGFKKVGDVYTLPLVVGAHTAVDPTTGGTGGGKGGLGVLSRHLSVLLSVEKDSRGYLKDISKSVKGGDGVGIHGGLHGGTSTGTGGGGGGGGSSVSLSDRLTAAVDKIVGTINKFATPKEARGVVERVAAKGLDTTFIRKSIQQVSAELGKTAAKRYGDALRALDQATRDSEKRRNAALEESLAAIEAIRQAHQAKMEARRTKQALGFEMKNVPTLPRGHTNIDVNRHALGGPGHHPKALTIVLDRRHYADQLSQEVSYGRGY